MSTSILLAAAWVFAATAVAFLPLRLQMVPGLALNPTLAPAPAPAL